ncbi:MAG: 3-isopropylmalate dehydrogenase [Alphaproteobacteria bacterium]|nr:3-isopropylmalate dehydrogenase [Alphaproteobacteria bacterium]MBL6953671.1 3-isopropylmalate dehydrogenase [Alphaproteobacteria bacterium]
MGLSYRMVVLGGDGIGPEVTAEAVRVMDWFGEHRGLDITARHELYGAAAYRAHGGVIAEQVMADLQTVDAVLFGATGGPKYDEIPLEIRRRHSLLRIRRHMEVFANLRPVIGYDELADTISMKAEAISGVNMMIVRELNGGIYFGKPRGITETANGLERGVNTLVYETPEIERIARFAFDLAEQRGGHLHSIDKSNVLECHQLWRKIVTRIGAEEYPGVSLEHMIVDNCAMQIIREPKQFDVMLADNMFGDILSDLAGAISGSLGMLPSASLSMPDDTGRRRALYEPVHGSAPDIAGQGIANPLGAILSFALALELSFNSPGEAEMLRRAVRGALAAGVRTPDILAAGGDAASTTEMTDAVLVQLERLQDA